MIKIKHKNNKQTNKHYWLFPKAAIIFNQVCEIYTSCVLTDNITVERDCKAYSGRAICVFTIIPSTLTFFLKKKRQIKTTNKNGIPKQSFPCTTAQVKTPKSRSFI